MNRSFYNGVSGIKTHQFGVDVWADNISNINNTGFRAARPEFSNILSQSIYQSSYGPAVSQAGLGAMGQTTSMQEGQGGLVDADQPFDMALKDEGWFGTQGMDGNTYYTRRGDFSLDGAGNLVAKNGNFVLGSMGTNINADGTLKASDGITLGGVAAQKKIQLPQKLTMPAIPTTSVLYKGNIDPTIKREVVDLKLADSNFTHTIDTTKKTVSAQGDVKDVKGLQNPKEGDTIYLILKDEQGRHKEVSTTLDKDLKWKIDGSGIDGINLDGKIDATAQIRTNQEVPNTAGFSTKIIAPTGEENVLSMDFTKKVPQSKYENSWEVVVTVKDDSGKILETETGEMTFTGNGAVKSSTIKSIKNGTEELTLNLGTPYDSSKDNTGFDGVTSIASGKYGSSSMKKNGYIAGNLTKYGLDDYGQIQAYFDNGRNVPIAKIAVYHFQNDQGLTREGGDYFMQSPNSGKPIFYKDKDGNFINNTVIASKKLEMSNVSLATALTEVIVMQKAYDASSKSITTSDQMIQKAINMKR